MVIRNPCRRCIVRVNCSKQCSDYVLYEKELLRRKEAVRRIAKFNVNMVRKLVKFTRSFYIVDLIWYSVAAAYILALLGIVIIY